MARAKKQKAWTDADIAQLWNGSLSEVARKLKRTRNSVSFARTKYKSRRFETQEEQPEAEIARPKPRASKLRATPAGNNSTFRAVFNGQVLELPTTPQSINLTNAGLEIKF